MVRLFALVASTVVLGAGSFFTARQAILNSPQPTITPFTATEREGKYDSRGQMRHEEIFTIAFRSDGSLVKSTRRRLPDGNWYEMKNVTNVTSGKRTLVDYSTKSTTTYSFDPKSYLLGLAKEASSCLTASSSERSTLLGYSVVHIQNTLSFQDLSKTDDLWEAPGLNCYALKATKVPFQKPGAIIPKNEIEVTAVIPGEPDPALFVVPTDFTERSPSEHIKEHQRVFGDTSVIPKDADNAYSQHRQ